jgi:hypothetical protein
MFPKRVIVSSLCLVALTSGCGGHQTSTGTINGVFQEVGGPPELGPRPLAGIVELTSSLGKHSSLTVGKDGDFRARVAPGTYSATGKYPPGKSGQLEMTCQGLAPVVVHAGQAVHMTVECEVP